MSLCFYSLTLQTPGAIQSTAVGFFTGEKDQDLVVAKGSFLELYSVVSSKLNLIASTNTFSVIKCIEAVRVDGSKKEVLAVTSDSGCFCLLAFANGQWSRVAYHPFGKSGIRRLVPGEYLTADPKGRAILLSSVEKNKLVYVVNSGDSNPESTPSDSNVNIASPLEASSSNSVTFDIVAVDTGYDNPGFAALESLYNSPSVKYLNYYELDLGLNSVIRKWSKQVDIKANKLMQVPRPYGGVLVCYGGNILYVQGGKKTQNFPPLTVPIRKSSINSLDSELTPGSDGPNGQKLDGVRNLSINTYSAICTHVLVKLHKSFFYLLQNGYGDLLKLTLERGEDKSSIIFKISYFDTIKPAKRMVVLKSGYLFVAAESGPNQLFQFIGLGDDFDASGTKFSFRKDPQNLVLVDSDQSLSPIISGYMDQESGNLAVLGGDNTWSSISKGIAVEVFVSADLLPSTPLAVWSLRLQASSDYDDYVVFAFLNRTLVLKVGESIEETQTSGLLANVTTLLVQQIGSKSIVQVHPDGFSVFQFVGGESPRKVDWEVPAGLGVKFAVANRYQLVLILSSNEVAYFELNSEECLVEYQERKKISGLVRSLDIGEVPTGRVRSPLVAIGCADDTIRVLSLDKKSLLEVVNVQALSAPANDVKILTNEDGKLFICIGLDNGVFISSALDPFSGEFISPRSRFIGPEPLTISSVFVESRRVVVVRSTKLWVGWFHNGSDADFTISPLMYPLIDGLSGFSSPQCPDSIVAFKKGQLHIFSPVELEKVMQQKIVALSASPRRMAVFEKVTYAISSQVQRSDSVLEVINSNTVVQKIDLERQAFSICTVQTLELTYVMVGTSSTSPRSETSAASSSSVVKTYGVANADGSLFFMFDTPVEGLVAAIDVSEGGNVVMAMDDTVKVYSIGRKQLLRKAQYKLPNSTRITSLKCERDRIIVSDIHQSLSYLSYSPEELALSLVANDILARHITSTCVLDYNQTIAGDRFGNIFTLRYPSEATNSEHHDPGSIEVSDTKLQLSTHFFVQDMPTGIFTAELVSGALEVALWTGLQGTIGAMIPFSSRKDFVFFEKLVDELRKHVPKLTGRDHFVYRGLYAPSKCTIDGDFCEIFKKLSNETKRTIAMKLGKSVNEVSRRITDMRVKNVG